LLICSKIIYYNTLNIYSGKVFCNRKNEHRFGILRN
jgi:hypothetical protein